MTTPKRKTTKNRKPIRIASNAAEGTIGDVWEGPFAWWVCATNIGPLHLRWRKATAAEEKKITAYLKRKKALKRKADLEVFSQRKIYPALLTTWHYIASGESVTLYHIAIGECKKLARNSDYDVSEVWNAVYAKAGVMCYDAVSNTLV